MSQSLSESPVSFEVSPSIKSSSLQYSNSPKMQGEQAIFEKVTLANLEKNYNDSVIFEGGSVLRGDFDPISKIFWVSGTRAIDFYQRNHDNTIVVRP
jgi:hypothetical protein